MSDVIGLLGTFGTPEMIFIFVLVLILFGAKKIPEFAKGLGKGLGEFKKAKREFEDELMSAEHEASQPAPKKKATQKAKVVKEVETEEV